MGYFYVQDNTPLLSTVICNLSIVSLFDHPTI